MVRRLGRFHNPAAHGPEHQVARRGHEVEFLLVEDLSVFVSAEDTKLIEPVPARAGRNSGKHVK
jgi:hypothetical protein